VLRCRAVFEAFRCKRQSEAPDAAKQDAAAGARLGSVADSLPTKRPRDDSAAAAAAPALPEMEDPPPSPLVHKRRRAVVSSEPAEQLVASKVSTTMVQAKLLIPVDMMGADKAVPLLTCVQGRLRLFSGFCSCRQRNSRATALRSGGCAERQQREGANAEPRAARRAAGVGEGPGQVTNGKAFVALRSGE